ncbi:alanine racemase [Cellulomonas denverensis]|uniref:Alanine racemase n=1 Tax=Cellulomonas denverensis TaxID=264297 RepID=A0A7X6KWS6_9CELL|nr:alanine racemase [Cellulomonas denverensis]NKY23625.1 alanine racemase [Cellulomonas denverensis]GIG26895.1 alanine racemase [Cellulomonas denverensis]
MSLYPARAVVDLGAIRANARTLVRIADGAAVMAVVKADAYGHGLVPVARAAVQGGASWLGTAQLAEALALREAGIDARVLTWLYAPGAPLDLAVAADIDLGVAAGWALDEVVAAARATGRTARVHLKVDTGLGRNGVTPAELGPVLDAAARHQAEGLIRVVGVFSHLAFADTPGHPTLDHQLGVLHQAVEAARSRGIEPELRHLAASAAALTAPELHLDLVRAGLALYGLSPVPQVGGPADFGLVPAMTLEAEFATVKQLPAGHGMSYSHHYVTPVDTTVGVVPLGYGDGIPRHASGVDGAPGAPVAVGGRELAIAGRVCMDQFMVDLGPGAAEVAGDRVTLFGPGGPSAEDWARAAGTISYEIVTRLGARVPRVYVDSDEGVKGEA